jgi:predicted ferric reductase
VSYELWYAIHITAYAGIALGWFHQIPTGNDLIHITAAEWYWRSLYIATLALIAWRVAVPFINAFRHRLRIGEVVHEAPGVVSLRLVGRRLDKMRAAPGQFFIWRFLARCFWWAPLPFSLSAAPDGRRLRITVKGLGDYSTSLRDVRPGTRVVVEGPFGGFRAAGRRVALIAGGVGITPIRALLEDMPGDIAVIYRAAREEDVILRAELDELARRRGADLHYVVGGEPLSPDRLLALVPDIAERDVYVCGPPAMTEATRASLGRSGVPRRQVFVERFAL